MNKAKLKIIPIILVFFIFLFIIWKLSNFFLRDIFTGPFTKQSGGNSIENNVEMKQVENLYYIRVKNITGTTAVGRTEKHTYYNMDIMVETDSYAAAKLMTTNGKKTLNAINDAIAHYSGEDLSTPDGVEKLKYRITGNLAEAYRTNKISNIYMEKYLFQNK